MELYKNTKGYYGEYLYIYFIRPRVFGSTTSDNSLRNVLYFHPYTEDPDKVLVLGKNNTGMILDNYDILISLAINYITIYNEPGFVGALITDTINMVIEFVNHTIEGNLVISEVDVANVEIEIYVPEDHVQASTSIITGILSSLSSSKEKTNLEKVINGSTKAITFIKDAREQGRMPIISKPVKGFIEGLLKRLVEEENQASEEGYIYTRHTFVYKRNSISIKKDIPTGFIGLLSNYDNKTRGRGDIYARAKSINDFYFKEELPTGLKDINVPEFKVSEDNNYLFEEKSGIMVPNSKLSLMDFLNLDPNREDIEDVLDVNNNTRYVITLYELQKLFMDTFEMDINTSFELMRIICNLFKEEKVMDYLGKIASFFIYRKKYKG